ncbi:hypothetical protein JHK86_002796 [Glycine max]|nr:hypothetical protein JHK86_002796 [Glycine max]
MLFTLCNYRPKKLQSFVVVATLVLRCFAISTITNDEHFIIPDTHNTTFKVALSRVLTGVPCIVARSLFCEECDFNDGEVHRDGGNVEEGEGFGNRNDELVLGCSLLVEELFDDR